MHRFYDGQREVEIPTALEELTPEQYRYFVTLSSIHESMATMSDEGFRVRWLSYLSGLGTIDFTLLVAERAARYREAMGMTDGFFLRGADGRLLPNFETQANLLPEEGGFKGPGDWLEGLTWEEFAECSSVVKALGETGAPEGSDDYRKAVMEGYEHIARVLYRIPEGESVPDILYFHAPTLLRNVMHGIESGPVRINGEEIDLRIIFRNSGGSRGPDDKTGWLGVTFEVASSGVFGGVREVEKTDFWVVLLYLYRCKFEYLHSRKKG